MEKQAQKLGPLTKAREWINRPGEKLMSSWSPEFGELIQKLHEVDEQVREIVIGEKGESLKDLLKLAKTNFNRREYMVALAFLGKFHNIMEDVSNKLASLGTAVDVKHNDFLFGDMEPEDIEYITQKLGPKFKAKKVKQQIKAAGLKDWWRIMMGGRAGAMAAWERSFPKKAKELKKQIANLLSKSEALLSNLLATLKVLGSYRAARKLEDYLKLSAKFIQRYEQYDVLFANIYNENMATLVDMQVDKMKPKDESPFQPAGIPSKERTKPVEHPKPGTNPLQYLIDAEEQRKAQQEQAKQIQLAKLPKVSNEPDVDKEDTIVDKIKEDITKREIPIRAINHEVFISKVAALEEESPFVIASELILYAAKIKDEDPETSEKLTQLSQKLLAE